MSRVVRGALIQAKLCEPATSSVEKIKQAMTDKHVGMIEEAAKKGAQFVCLQELFNGPYFCAEQQPKWYEMVESVPDGPTIKLMQELAAKHELVTVVPIYEEDLPGVYYNTAAVIDADGKYFGKFRKIHIPHCTPDSGKSSISNPEILAIRYLTRGSAKSVFISVTTGISPTAPVALDLMEQKSYSTHRRPSRD